MLPEIVLIENERGTLLQVNSLGPVYAGRMERFIRQALAAPPRRRAAIPYRLEPDSRDAWRAAVGTGLDAIGAVSYTHLDVYKRQPLREVQREPSS